MNIEINNGVNGNALVSYKQAAAMLNICVRTLRRMVDVGQLAASITLLSILLLLFRFFCNVDFHEME